MTKKTLGFCWKGTQDGVKSHGRNIVLQTGQVLIQFLFNFMAAQLQPHDLPVEAVQVFYFLFFHTDDLFHFGFIHFIHNLTDK